MEMLNFLSKKETLQLQSEVKPDLTLGQNRRKLKNFLVVDNLCLQCVWHIYKQFISFSCPHWFTASATVEWVSTHGVHQAKQQSGENLAP